MHKDKKTFIILTPGFAANEGDTTCIPMQQSFIRTLNRLLPDKNIIILAFEYPYVKETYKWFGNTVISFNGRNKGGLTRFLLRRQVAERLKGIHSENEITGLLSFWYGECALAGKKFATKYGIRHYCWMWGQDARKENKYVKQARLKAGELLAFSDFVQDEFEKNHGTRPQHVTPPGIDTSSFPLTDTDKDIDIIGAGSLIPLKQYDVFIEAIAEIRKSIPTVKAILIGDGPEKKRLQELVTSLELQSNITLAGELAHKEVLRWMQRGKIFLHPSSYEGFGIVCIEALCAGAKVISFVKPMKKQIENWSIVINKEEMISRATEILRTPRMQYEKVIVYSIEEPVRKIMELFSS